MKKTFLTLMLALFAGVQWCAAQSACQTSFCSRDTLLIRSGFNHGTNSLYSYGSGDAYFLITQTPSSSSTSAAPFVIAPHPAWYTLPGTRWISANSVARSYSNNPAPANPYVFRTQFCTCQDDSAFINLQIGADDEVEVFLDGVSLGNFTAGWYFQAANTININHTAYLVAGTHSLEFKLRNTGGVAMGLNVKGSVIGGFTLKHACCDPNSSICGTKYEDANGNGTRDNGENGLQNWKIILEDSSGNPIDTMLTDQYGDYCFTNLIPGTYSVREVNQTSWWQMQPANGGKYTFTLDTLEVEMGLFGNHYCPADLRDTVILNTGYNPTTDSTYTIGDDDQYWTIIDDPWNNNPYSAITVYPTGGYQPALPNSTWLNFPGNMRPGTASTNGIFSYERCFCLAPGFTNAELDLNFRVDDSAKVYLNGNFLGDAIVPSFNAVNPTNLNVTNQSFFRIGQNCIQVDVRNFGGPTGFNLQGFVTADAVQVVDRCCDSSEQSFIPGGSICGIKFNDLNCDGVLDIGEPLLPNWTIILTDGNNQGMDTVVTDSFGSYCFERLVAGQYIVREFLPANWDQSFPGSPTWQHVIQLARNEGQTADFGNCEETCFVNSVLRLGTGYDLTLMTPYATGANDPNWTVLSDPLGNMGTQPWVQPYFVPFWFSTGSPSQWITSDPNQPSPTGTYSYELCFCIKDSVQNIAANFDFRADDSAVIYINGNLVMWIPSGSATAPMPVGVGIPNSFLVPGRNCIQVDVINTTPGETGFSLNGQVTSSNPYNLNHQCCPRGPEPNPGTNIIRPRIAPKPYGSLKQNIPNPAQASTSIGYYLPEGSMQAQITIYDIQGRLIKTIPLNQTGEAEVTVQTNDMNAGVYIYKLSANGISIDSKHMIIHK
ncbi:MAG: SdrD B-like domain-containing protein [Bacteroidia bacterium]